MNKLYLIDGHALIFRMYYAFLRRPMVNSKGKDTSILFGFTKYILELIKREGVTHLAVALDPPCKTFRHEMYPEYKGTRSATPELVKEAYEPIKEIVTALNIPLIIIEGYEADDVIGAMAKKCASDETDVFMVTPDKDYGQLLAPHIFQYKPGKGGADKEIISDKDICEKFGIENPKQVIDILAIWGDASDNVPGVKGVGEVGAKKLVSQWGSVENILEHTSELSKKQAEAFEAARQTLPLSKTLVTIITDMELECNLEKSILNIENNSKISQLFSDLEMNSLMSLLPKGNPKSTNNTTISTEEKAQKEIEYKIVDKKNIAQSAIKTKYLSLKIEEGVLYASSENKVFICKDLGELVNNSTNNSDYNSLPSLFENINNDSLKEILEDENIIKIGYNLKKYIKELRRAGVNLKGDLHDVEIMHYLINPETTHNIDVLSRSLLGIDLQNIGTNSEEEEKNDSAPDLFSAIEEEKPEEKEKKEKANIYRCVILKDLHDIIFKEFEKEPNLIELYNKIEMPLINVLSDMEYEGFRIDRKVLKELSNTLTAQVLEIEKEVRDLAQEPGLNVSSPKQLGIILFEKLKLDPKVKKSAKGNYSTDEETLNGIKDTHPIVRKILEFRALKKLVSTYIDPLPELINESTGNIHTTFNQALTATGRLSSSKPNLQNIPIRTEQGREIRRAFISSHKDGIIVSADYSQIELRIMAALSNDEHMVKAFKENKDVHTATAAKIFGISEEEVNSEQRRRAKMANFGIIYGISVFGLAQRLDIPRNESKMLIDEYFKNYKGVEEYIEKMKEKARTDGYVETIFHRKRFLPDINSRNQIVRGLAERNAVNAPIQGSAADLIKLAMINVYNKIKYKGLKSRMVLQVHDELILDVLPSEKEAIIDIVRNEMENVISLIIPLTVQCDYGINWLEAH